MSFWRNAKGASQHASNLAGLVRRGGPIAFAVLASLALRLPIWTAVRHPGHADPAFYVALAANLAAGRGFVIDYVWHFLTPDQELTHFAADYWQPVPSLLMALPMFFTESGTKAAVLANVVASAFTAGLAAAYGAKRFGVRGGAVAGMAVATLPQTMAWSLQADSVVAASLALLLAYSLVDWIQSSAGAVSAGVCLGLALGCRQDSVTAAVPLMWLLAVQQPVGARLRPLLFLASGTALPVLALAVLAYSYDVAPFPRSGQAFFLLEYEDLFRLGGPDHARFLAVPLADHVARFLSAAAENGFAWSAETRHFGWPAIAFILMRARRDHLCMAAGLHFALLLLLYSVLSEVGVNGGFRHGSAAAIPPLVLAIARGLPHLGHVAKVAGVTALAWLAVAGVNRAKGVVTRNNGIGDETASLARVILSDGGPNAVVMTRSPWQLALHGLKAVQIPTGDEHAISSVARRYGVTHVVMADPAARPHLDGWIRNEPFRQLPATGKIRVYASTIVRSPESLR
jgi:hypothetical protein